MERYAVIVAGGKGERMGSNTPKQFLPINGEPILMLTIKRFIQFDASIHIIVVLPKLQMEEWETLCKQHRFDIPHNVTAGGSSRFYSVKNGLNLVPENCIVAIHDGVRPFVSDDTLKRCFTTAETQQSAIPVIPLVDSIRSISSDNSRAENRERFRLVQTPQIFQSHLIKKAFEQPYSSTFTDEASVIEAYGGNINLVEGNRENIKITTPFDLFIAKILLTKDSL